MADEDPRITQYAAERDALAAAIHKRVNSSSIARTVPYLIGDADRAVTAVICEGWTPPLAPTDEVEEYDEWRLSGQPEDDPRFYDHIGRTPEEIRLLKAIWRKIEGGDAGYRWTGAKLERRRVRIVRSAWTDATGDDRA